MSRVAFVAALRRTFTTTAAVSAAIPSHSGATMSRRGSGNDGGVSPSNDDVNDGHGDGSAGPSKTLYVVRHGQAKHNPRAEAARANGCSMEEFLDLMRQDDALDADLTELGRLQAKECRARHFAGGADGGDGGRRIGLVVSSPLSRAMETADLVYPPTPPSSAPASSSSSSSRSVPERICCEDFREVNGELMNGQRRTRTELLGRFPGWNLDRLGTDHDDTWTPHEMEDPASVAERGYRGLTWLLDGRPEPAVLLVSHGGLLRHTMNDHPLVHLADGRRMATGPPIDDKGALGTKPVGARFDNCEVRKYRLAWKDDYGEKDGGNDGAGSVGGRTTRRPILLTQIDH